MNEEQKKAFHNYQKASMETYKLLKRNWLKKCCIGLLIFIMISLFISSLRGIGVYFPKYLRYYDVRLNDYQLNIAEKINPTVIIPKILSINNGENGTFYSENISPNIEINQKPYLLNIKSYTCFSPYAKKKRKTSCNQENKSMERMQENKDTSYKMKIRKYSYEGKYTYILGMGEVSYDFEKKENSHIVRKIENYEIIYDGDFLENLTYYLENKGVYMIDLAFSYKFQRGNLYIGIINDGNSIYTF